MTLSCTYINDVVEILLRQHGELRHLQQEHTSRHVVVFRHPRTDNVVARGPRKVANSSIELVGLLVEQGEGVGLVYGQRTLLVDARKVLVIVRPLEGRPGRIEIGECTHLLTGDDVPNDNGLIFALLLRLLRVGDNVLLAGREVDQLDARVVELLVLGPLGSSP